MISRETDSTKQESSTIDDPRSFRPSSSSSTSSWSRLKDPRIVRVSRAFGGKDRHSKVCTVRGLRDRRVRLSVPTAIQLYDLQDRLGLSQPSKVVDWLLNAAKHEIDGLPALQIPTGAFNINHPSLFPTINSQLDIPNGVPTETNDGDESWARDINDQEAYDCSEQNSSSLSCLMNSSTPYNSFARWDPPSLTLSHPPRSNGLSPHPPEHWPNFSLTPSGSHQVLVYQPGMSSHAYFSSHIGGPNTELGPKQLNFQDSTAQSGRPIHNFDMTANLLSSQNEG